MDRFLVLAGCVLFAVGGQVAAQCSTNRVNLGTNLLAFLSGKTACATGVGANAGKKWQEWHQANGTLTEYAKGANDPVDPTHDVGTWSASNGANAVVTYTYTGDSGSPYIWALYDDGGGNYSFCTGANGAVIATTTFLNGQGHCPGF